MVMAVAGHRSTPSATTKCEIKRSSKFENYAIQKIKKSKKVKSLNQTRYASAAHEVGMPKELRSSSIHTEMHRARRGEDNTMDEEHVIRGGDSVQACTSDFARLHGSALCGGLGCDERRDEEDGRRP